MAGRRRAGVRISRWSPRSRSAWRAPLALLGGDERRARPRSSPRPGDEDPFAYDPDREDEFTARAAAGLSHVLYAKSPGGAVASAERVARYRDVVEGVAEDTDFDPDTIEGIVLLESAGRPDATAANDPRGAVGLTQILAETGQNLLDMRIDTARSRRLTRRIARAERRGRDRARRAPARAAPARRRALRPGEGARGHRAVPDVRPRRARRPRRPRGRQLPHGRRQPAERRSRRSAPARTRRTPRSSSTPARCATRAAWGILAGLGDDSSTYLWRVEAAKDIMRRYREDPAALERRADAMTAKNSAEEVLHPEGTTESFAEPEAIETALDSGELTSLPAAGLRRRGRRGSTRAMGELAPRLEQPRSLYRALRPEALALLVYLARGTKAIGGQRRSCSRAPCATRATSGCSPRRNIEATHGYSLHTTGWAFDIERTLPLAPPGARVPVHARPPAGAEPHRLGARARRDPHHGGPRGRGAARPAQASAAPDLLGDVVGVDAEALEHLGARRRRAEAVDRDLRRGVAVPAERDAGLDRDRRRAVGQHLGAVGVVLLLEELPARHRHDADVEPSAASFSRASSATHTSLPVATIVRVVAVGAGRTRRGRRPRRVPSSTGRSWRESDIAAGPSRSSRITRHASAVSSASAGRR